MWSSALLRRLVRHNPKQFVDIVFQAVLGRDADNAGLATYGGELRTTGDLGSVIRSVVRSAEARNKNCFRNPISLIEQVFRGILGRAPEDAAVKYYTDYLSGSNDLAGFLSIVCQSQEHWEKLIADRAEDVVRAAFLGILQRAPDAEALSVYSAQLRQQRDLPSLLAILATSQEHRDNLLQVTRRSAPLFRSDHLPSILAEVISSPKVWNDLSALKFPSPGPSSAAFDNDAWVFIHAQKTGGTSLQNMLVDTFGEGNVYREHADSLYLRSPAELSPYSVFAGHFNYDSVSYIPRERKTLFTFLRDPKQRLMSLYRFLRSHNPMAGTSKYDPSSPAFEDGIEIANQSDILEFFPSMQAVSANETWNHLTWCVMGRRQWSIYKKRIEGLVGDTLRRELDIIRIDIRRRLEEFAFIGLQEDFAHSCQRLFELIGLRAPNLRHDHSVALLSSNLRHFKYVPQRPITPELDAALTPLVVLDNILYREASDIYTLQNGRVLHDGEFRTA